MDSFLSILECVCLCFFILFEISFADTSLPPTNQSDFCGNWAHSFDINSRKLFMCLVWFTNYPLLNGFCDLCVGIFFVNIYECLCRSFERSIPFPPTDLLLSLLTLSVMMKFYLIDSVSFAANSINCIHCCRWWQVAINSVIFSSIENMKNFLPSTASTHTHIYRSALIIGVTTLTSMRWWKSIKIPACTPNHFVLSCGFLSTGSHFKWILCSTQYRIIDPNCKYFKGKKTQRCQISKITTFALQTTKETYFQFAVPIPRKCKR